MNSYYDDRGPGPLDAVTIDLVAIHALGLTGWLVTRIYTSPGIRGRGRASRLLDTLCADADREGATLYLEINPYGDLGLRQLEEWYARKGFRWTGLLWQRQPRANT